MSLVKKCTGSTALRSGESAQRREREKRTQKRRDVLGRVLAQDIADGVQPVHREAAGAAHHRPVATPSQCTVKVFVITPLNLYELTRARARRSSGTSGRWRSRRSGTSTAGPCRAGTSGHTPRRHGSLCEKSKSDVLARKTQTSKQTNRDSSASSALTSWGRNFTSASVVRMYGH
jgi:hypothetical protein